MSARDELAERIMLAMLPQVYDYEEGRSDTQEARFRNVARDAYMMADAMEYVRQEEQEAEVPEATAPTLPPATPVAPEDDVGALDLPARVANQLRSHGVTTVAQLIERSAVDLLKLPNLGSRSLRVIESELRHRGMSLAARYEPGKF